MDAYCPSHGQATHWRVAGLHPGTALHCPASLGSSFAQLQSIVWPHAVSPRGGRSGPESQCYGGELLAAEGAPAPTGRARHGRALPQPQTRNTLEGLRDTSWLSTSLSCFVGQQLRSGSERRVVHPASRCGGRSRPEGRCCGGQLLTTVAVAARCSSFSQVQDVSWCIQFNDVVVAACTKLIAVVVVCSLACTGSPLRTLAS